MKYNEEYNCWVSKEGLIFRATKTGKLRLLKPFMKDGDSYLMVALKKPSNKLVHKVVWETFNGKAPDGYEIDHVNDNKFDNRLDNLQVLSRKDNCGKSHRRLALHNAFVNMVRSDFGKRFFEVYGHSKTENPNLYARELQYYKRTGHLRGENNV